MKKRDYITPATLAAIHDLSRQDEHELRHTSLLKPGNVKTGTHGKHGAMRLTKGLAVRDLREAPDSDRGTRKRSSVVIA